MTKSSDIAKRIFESTFSKLDIILLIGAYDAAIISNMATHFGISIRLRELHELQRAHYPAGRGRKKNVHAYLVADKLARFYANRCKKKPSFGTGDYRLPSTDYARALESIFAILGIQAALRGPAESAIASLKPADINPELASFNALGSMFGFSAN